MVKAYIFGDRFLANAFRKAVHHQLMEQILFDPYSAWFYAAKVAFQHLPENDLLLKFLVDINCRYCSNKDYWFMIEDGTEDYENKVIPQLPAKLLLLR
jgi:hypothetical protein